MKESKSIYVYFTNLLNDFVLIVSMFNILFFMCMLNKKVGQKLKTFTSNRETLSHTLIGRIVSYDRNINKFKREKKNFSVQIY